MVVKVGKTRLAQGKRKARRRALRIMGARTNLEELDSFSDLSYRGQLSEGTEGPPGEVKGGSSLEVASKGRLWRKGSRKGVDRGVHRVNALLSHLSRL